MRLCPVISEYDSEAALEGLVEMVRRPKDLRCQGLPWGWVWHVLYLEGEISDARPHHTSEATWPRKPLYRQELGVCGMGLMIVDVRQIRSS